MAFNSITEAGIAPRRIDRGIRYGLLSDQRDAVLLVGRVGIIALFLMFGWTYVTDFPSFLAYLQRVDAPWPPLAGSVALVMEFFGGIAMLLGFYTRPLALVFAVYTMGTAFIGHHYWTMVQPDFHANYVHFFKNVCISAGFLFLCVSGPGAYSLDRR